MFFSFDVNDYLIHNKYGVGQFIGLENITINNTSMDFFRIAYQNQSYVLIPSYNIGTFKFHSKKEAGTIIDVLGRSNVLKKEEKIRKEISDTASELIKIYKDRELVSVSTFKNNSMYSRFCDVFEFSLTSSQEKAMKDIVEDLSKTKPMDRLLCGDVGFGKTEVAARALALALSNGKKAIFIVPTTILASQHFELLQKRFELIGKNCGLLSKLNEKSAKTKNSWLKGELDLLITTAHHKGIDKLIIDNVGLIILDEEHHFGAKFKEKIRLKSHFLQLSATPIPRTLHLALSNIKDISTLEIPPVGRKSVNVIFETFKTLDIVSILQKEIKTNGKIFLVVPRIEFIKDIAELVGFTKFVILHGQLSKDETNKALDDFVNGNIHVLISTNIIESGMNILSANLMIIFHAHMFGVAQLHQLKGRVGRGDQQASVYFVVPESLKEISMERINLIKNNSEIGSGFALSMNDMDLRGTGTVVGHKQSGKDYGFGLEMYFDILSECLNETAVKKNERNIGWVGFSNAFIPADYIVDNRMRFSFYKKLSMVNDLKALNEIESDLLSFGEMPQSLCVFIKIVKINLIANYIEMNKVQNHDDYIEIFYNDISLDLFVNIQKLSKIDCANKKIILNEDKINFLILLLEEIKGF